MSKYSVRDPSVVPPGGYSYKQLETGFACSANTSYETSLILVKHRIANGLPRATQEEAEADVIEQACMLLGSQWCRNETFETFGLSDGWDRIKAGTRTLAAWAKESLLGGSDPYVSQEIAEKRADGCRNCFARTIKSGCLSCGWLDLVRALIGETIDKHVELEETSSCRVCGCLLAAKCHLKADILKAGLTDTQKRAYAEVGDHCFMNRLDN